MNTLIDNEIMSRGWRAARQIATIFTIVNLLLLAAACYSASLAPQLMVDNYRSIKYGAEMQSALVAIYLDAVDGREPKKEDLARFDGNFFDQSHNITEVNEAETVGELDRLWSAFKKQPMTPTAESFHRISDTIQKIVALNESAMYKKEETALSIGKTILFGGFIGLFLAVAYSILIIYDGGEWVDKSKSLAKSG